MQTIRLSTTPGVVNPGANLSQYDVGRQIVFLLYDDTGKYVPAAGSTVKIRATKPSGFSFDADCYWSQNAVTVTITNEMSSESGSFPAELRITKDSAILGTANFLWNVERAPKQDGTIDGNAEAKNLMQAIQAAITDAETAAAAANSAAMTAGLSEDFKQALLDCFEHVAWIDGDGQEYYDALEAALYPPIPATGITITPSTINAHSLNVQEDLSVSLQPPNATDTVTFSSSNTSVATVSESGTVRIIGWGSATITATAGNVSATCTVSATNVTLSSIDAVFTQGSATIYTDDTLDSLKQYLVVTATYSDSSTEVLDDSDYTLSGTLTAGTSTITATYMTKTDTFNVTVTQAVQHYAIVNNLTNVASSNPVVTVEENDSFTTSLGVAIGYLMTSVSVTMGSTDITTSAYDEDTRTISIAAVTGNVVITAVAEDLAGFWNFKKSMDDEVSGTTPTVSGATRDSSGAHFTGLTDNINLGAVIGLNKTFVIKLGTTVRNSSTWTNASTTGVNGILFWTATGNPGNYGFGWNKSKQSFGYYTNGYSANGTTVTSRNPGDWEQFTSFNGTDMLSNATLKFTIDSNGVVHSYINGTEYKPVNEHTSESVYAAYQNEASCKNLVLGSPNSSYPVFRDMTIEYVKIYQGVV